MEIVIRVSDLEYAALEALAADQALATTPAAVATCVRQIVLGYLDTECKLDRDEVIKEILNPPTQEKPKVAQPINGLVLAAKTRQDKRVKDRESLTPPAKDRDGQITLVWRAWCWLAKVQLDQTGWHTFVTDDLAQGARIAGKKATNVATNLAGIDWIYVVRKDKGKTTPINVYGLTEKAKAWLKNADNQKWMIAEGVIDPVPAEEE